MNQRDRLLPWPFHKWGCHVLTLGKMVQVETNVELLHADYLYVAVEGMASEHKDGYVLGRDLRVNGPDQLLGMFISRAHWTGKVMIYQIGADGEYWKWVKLKRVDYTVLKGETVNGNYHFRLGDAQARQIYNPDPSVRIARELSIIYYQAIRLG